MTSTIHSAQNLLPGRPRGVNIRRSLGISCFAEKSLLGVVREPVQVCQAVVRSAKSARAQIFQTGDAIWCDDPNLIPAYEKSDARYVDGGLRNLRSWTGRHAAADCFGSQSGWPIAGRLLQ